MARAMSPLWLDYRRAPPGRQRPGWILLAVAVLVTVLLLARHARVSDELDAVQAQLAQAEAASAAPSAAAAAGEAEGPPPVAAAGWERLFAALEAAGDESVTLLSMQPGRGELRLGGEAVNHDAAVDYARRLNAGGVLGGVHLTQTEVLREHPQRPVRFALLAQWGAQGTQGTQGAGSGAGQESAP